MSEYMHKSHNVTVLMYNFVCLAKYRRVVIDENVDQVVRKPVWKYLKDIQFIFWR